MSDERDSNLILLIDRIAARDGGAAQRQQAEAALRELYETAAPRLYAVAMRVLGKRDWAEDVLQEAFMQVWRTAADYRHNLSPPLAWLGLITRSRALDFLRRRASERADTTAELDDVLAETVAGDSPNPMDTHEASEHAWALHECLRKLEAKQREVVSLAYFRDLSHGELAQQLKLPLGTVKTWLRRGLDQLRTCMARVA